MNSPARVTNPARPPLDRDRLMRRLADPRTSLTVLAAPAGYGKSMLLRQWQAADDRPFAWVSVDRRHDQAPMLIGAIAAELDRLEPLDERVLAPLLAPQPDLWSAVIPRLSAAIEARQEPFVLVLDDLHRVRDERTLAPLVTLAESMPVGSQLAVASREGPAIALGRLRTQRSVVELHADDLAMTEAEAAEVMSGFGIDAPAASLDPVLGKTEGWPAGVYLAGLVLAAADDPAVAVEDFCGDERLVSDYLREELIAGLPQDQRQFLTGTSILDRLTGPICDHVLELQGSAALLKELARSNLLLTPIYRRDGEYRLHGLLREVLATDLREGDEGLEATLRRRACRWYADHGDIERAVPQAIAGGHDELAADLIWANTASFRSSGRGALLEQWLAEFTDARTAELAPLSMARAAGFATSGDGAASEHWVAVAHEVIRDSTRPEDEQLRLAGHVIRAAAAARDGVVAMREDVERTYELLPDDNPWRSVCCLIEGVSWHLSGELDEASRWLEEGSRRGLTLAPNIGMLCLAQRSLLCDDIGDREESYRLADQALGAAELFGLGEDSSASLAFMIGAFAQARRGRSGEASHNLRSARRLLSGLTDFSYWYEAEARLVAGRTLLLLEEVGEARGMLAQAGRFIQRTPGASMLGRWAEVAWKDAETAARSFTDRWPLSPAELRILQFLPTHLSQREIADEMFVSTNTVKSHTKAVYRKLGVSSRTEAVAKARAVGLLDGGRSASASGDRAAASSAP